MIIIIVLLLQFMSPSPHFVSSHRDDACYFVSTVVVISLHSVPLMTPKLRLPAKNMDLIASAFCALFLRIKKRREEE